MPKPTHSQAPVVALCSVSLKGGYKVAAVLYVRWVTRVHYLIALVSSLSLQLLVADRIIPAG